MPGLASVIARFTKQKMVYWQYAGSDGFGKPTYTDPLNPVELPVRWEDRFVEIVTPDGRKVLSKAYILLASPIVIGSKVFLGTLLDWQALPNYPNLPTMNQGGSEVVLVKKTPDLKAKSFVYEAYL